MKSTENIFFEYAEGNLSPKEQQELLDQCAVDSEMAEELELWTSTKVALPKMVYPNKQLLIQPWYHFVSTKKFLAGTALVVAVSLGLLYFFQGQNDNTNELSQKQNSIAATKDESDHKEISTIPSIENSEPLKVATSSYTKKSLKENALPVSEAPRIAVKPMESESTLSQKNYFSTDEILFADSGKSIALSAYFLKRDTIHLSTVELPKMAKAPSKSKRKMNIKKLFQKVGPVKWTEEKTVPIKGF
ncbi:MAG: hypothetical protein NT150_00745 [Bacteroidetes bacterium]|nr:hypothetical protein [Bacteroidota bacterium]